MSKKNVFVVGLDEFNRKKLERLPQAAEFDFHPALDISDIRNVERYDMAALIDKAVKVIEDTPGAPAAVVAYFDFPATDIVPILAERFDLPGPSLESVLKCEHKYWSRLEQQKVAGDHIPQFFAFDPFDEDAYEQIPLTPPFWIKPVKSFRSYLAFKINDEVDFENNIQEVRENIDFLGEPFTYLFQTYPLPLEIGNMRESCLAESMLAGSMCTVEGYSFRGEVVVYGVVDSVREVDRSSFARYEYPSSLPQEVQFRMADVARRVIQEVGLDDSPFNIEFFWDQTANQVYLLEINPRISQAHTDIFEKVHGVSHHQVMLDVALGCRPRPLERKGDFPLAAHFMLRTFRPGRVVSVPTEEEIRVLTEAMPGTVIKVPVKEGQELEDLQGQDSYSFELANLFIGGRDQTELLAKYERCLEGLTFAIEVEESPYLSDY